MISCFHALQFLSLSHNAHAIPGLMDFVYQVCTCVCGGPRAASGSGGRRWGRCYHRAFRGHGRCGMGREIGGDGTPAARWDTWATSSSLCHPNPPSYPTALQWSEQSGRASDQQNKQASRLANKKKNFREEGEGVFGSVSCSVDDVHHAAPDYIGRGMMGDGAWIGKNKARLIYFERNTPLSLYQM